MNFNGRNKKERESLERAGVSLEVFQTARVAKKRKIVYYSDDALLQNGILFRTHSFIYYTSTGSRVVVVTEYNPLFINHPY